jgi:hypothetical protein
MDKVQLVPFGNLERFQVPRRLGKKEPHVRSSMILRWETLYPVLEEPLKANPQLKDRLKEAIQHKDKELSLSRNDYEQFNGLITKIEENWKIFLDKSKENIKDKVITC